MGGISGGPNSTPLAPSTLENKIQSRDFIPMQLFPLLVMDLFQNIVQSSPYPPVQAGKSLGYFSCLWDVAENFALLLSDLLDPVARAAATRPLSDMSNSSRDRPVLNKSKFLNR